MFWNSVHFGNFNWFNRITQTINVFVGRRSAIVPLSQFVRKYPEKVAYLSCDKLNKYAERIKDGQNDMLLLALSGMGKTRLVYECYKKERPEGSYYCPHSQGSQFLSDLTLFFQDERHKDSLLILDNCPNDTISSVYSLRDDHGMNTRLVFVNHNYFERPNIAGLEVVDFTSNDMRDEVNSYIEKEVLKTDADRFICEKIKDMADGYPQMAILLVEAYKKRGQIEVKDVGLLLIKILGNNDNDRLNALKCLSLFQPLGWQAPYHKQYETVIKSPILTGLRGTVKERKDVFDRCINHFKGEIVEVSSNWLNVRPLPLAIWLVGNWMDEHSNDIMIKVIDEFKQLPQRLSAQLADAMYRRLRNMEGNEKAERMVAEIKTRFENNPFGLEEVVCSDLGSRLFLAFAHVNYQATTDCINMGLAGKSINELREGIDGNVRRNIVWTLEKLCYPADSFKKAAMILARLALAENEDIGNNATGQLTQLFHLLLPGTEATLEDRLVFLREMLNNRDTFAPIILPCLSHALIAGGFNRMGGAEEFGLKRRTDYQPQNEEEVTYYWMECGKLLSEYLDYYPERLREVKRIVEDRSYQLMHKGRVAVVSIVATTVYERLEGAEWMQMYKHFYNAKKYFYAAYAPEEKEIIDKWIDRLRPKSFCNELKEVRLKVFDKYKLSYEEQYNYAQTLMKPLAERFTSEALYEDEGQVRALIEDKEYFDFGFSALLVKMMDGTALSEMLDRMYEVLMKKEDSIVSPFLYQSCRHFDGLEPFEHFLVRLRDAGRELTYIHLLANNEKEGLPVFHRIESEIVEGKVSDSGIATYLEQVGYATPESMLEMLRSETVRKKVGINEVMHYLERFQFGFDFNGHPELNDAIKEVMLSFEYDEERPSLNWDYSNYLVRFLENDHDPKFATAVSHKMIEMLNTHDTHGNFDRVFPTLLDHYIDDIWDEFSDCLVNKDYAAFFYQIKDEIGSGMGFGSGPLFLHGDERIKNLCEKYPESAPYCMALTAPVFYSATNAEGEVVHEDRFSDIVVWLLENYGDNPSTVDGLGGNMGSFSWTGSTISVYESQIACLKKVLDNPKMSSVVKKWAELNIKDFVQLKNAEQSRIDFERMHYQ